MLPTKIFPVEPRSVTNARFRLAMSIILGALVMIESLGARGQNSNLYQEPRFPQKAGFEFPTPESKLVEMRNHQDLVLMRNHAWGLFAGLVQPSEAHHPESAAIWETWYSRSETMAANGCEQLQQHHRKQRELELPLEIISGFDIDKEGPEHTTALNKAQQFFSGPGGSLRSNVLFNAAACHHIQQLALYDPAKLEKQKNDLDLANAPAQERDITPFPDRSIIVKAFWLRIDQSGKSIPTPKRSFADQQACVAANNCPTTSVKPAKANEPCNLPAAPGTPVLTSCFYNVPVTKENRDQITFSMTADVGDVLVLVGLHVITKEMSDWVWSTFWWSPNPSDPTYGSDRWDEQFIHGAWRNYLMDTTLSMETPWEKEAEPSSFTGTRSCISSDSPKAKIAFNPYLEGNLPNFGALSNCMNCHKQATFPRMVPEAAGAPQRGYLGPDAACFGQSLRVDYVWSLTPPAKDSKLEKFLEGLADMLHISLR